MVLLKIDYNYIVVYPLSPYLKAKLQRVQKSAASFGNNRCAKMADIIVLGWLPLKERTEMHILSTTHRALCNTFWSKLLWTYARVLHRNWVVAFAGTFQDVASKLFNCLPNNIKLETSAKM